MSDLNAITKIGILGSTGPLGLQLIKGGLERGLHICALARIPEKLGEYLHNPCVNAIQGDAHDPIAVGRVISDCDVIINCLGPRGLDVNVCSETQGIINTAVLGLSKLPRVVTVTSLGVGDSWSHSDLITRAIVLLFIRSVILDKDKQENIIKKDLDGKCEWVIVRPTGMTNKPGTGRYGYGPDMFGWMISRADVATFILEKCISGTELVNKAVSVASL